MKMGPAEKQNIAVQHRIWNKNRKPHILTFKEWLVYGMNKYHKECGFTFELVTPYLMRIVRPGHPSLLRTCEDFRREYESCYLRRKPRGTNLPSF